MSSTRAFAFLALAAAIATSAARGQGLSGVRTEVEIADSIGGFSGSLSDQDHFGAAITTIGDLDGNGAVDLAVGAPGGGANDRGVVWILFLDGAGQVISQSKISAASAPFLGIKNEDHFGGALADLGDVDGDGRHELVVGSPGHDGPPPMNNRGAVYVLFLDASAAVTDFAMFSSTNGSLPGWLAWDHERLGSALAVPANIGPSAEATIAMGISSLDVTREGAFLIVELDFDPAFHSLWPSAVHRISETQGGAGGGGFGGSLERFDLFGSALADLGDLDGSGPSLAALAVGAPNDDDGNQCQHPPPPDPCNMGAVWILFFDASWQVSAHQKISSSSLPVALDYGDYFGSSVAWLDPFDAQQNRVLLVGAPYDDDAASGAGAAYLVGLDVQLSAGVPTVSVAASQKISAEEGLFAGRLHNHSHFGSEVAVLGDRDGDGTLEYLVGAPGQDQGGAGRGALWEIFPGERFPVHCGCDDQGQPCAPGTLTCRNMQNSLVHLDGVPRLGSTVTLAFDALYHCPGTTLALLVLSPKLDRNYALTGCGTLAPDWGWLAFTDPAAPAPYPVPGEILVKEAAGGVLLGPIWRGAPATIPIPIPVMPALADLTIYAQGVMVDFSNNSCGLQCGSWTCWVARSLTNMIELVIVP